MGVGGEETTIVGVTMVEIRTIVDKAGATTPVIKFVRSIIDGIIGESGANEHSRLKYAQKSQANEHSHPN